MNPTLSDLMREATRLTRSGRLNEATATLQRALAGPSKASSPARAARPSLPDTVVLPSASPWIVDARVVEVDAREGLPVAGPGEFSAGLHTCGAQSRRYKLYVPPGAAGRALPLVVMLHGCTQNPDDFARGTAMNERAREQGFFVLYPEQSTEVNPSRCWNWFKHNHQQRDRGEPALIATLTQAVIRQHGIDPRRVYIAGLSAGGAMAAIVAATYPELFAAVGVHSGLPHGAASNLPEAFAAMKGQTGAQGRQADAPQAPRRHVPTIVFHGDQDPTVHPRNGEQVIAATLAGAGSAGSPRVEQGVSAHGRRYTRRVHHGEQGQAVAEHWLVHGAGHAWSGGHASGSYTDAQGPDATGEMLRFFFDQPPRFDH